MSKRGLELPKRQPTRLLLGHRELEQRFPGAGSASLARMFAYGGDRRPGRPWRSSTSWGLIHRALGSTPVRMTSLSALRAPGELADQA